MALPIALGGLFAADSFDLNYEVVGNEVTRETTVGSQTSKHTRKRYSPKLRNDPFADWWGSYIRGERQGVDRNARQLRFMDLFSSVGGLSIGAMEAAAALGMRGVPLLAADVDERALQVYRANIRPRFTATDSVRGMLDFRVSGSGANAEFAYQPRATDERLASFVDATDLILAGPPCQGHSSLNNHSRHDDPKNLLYLTVPAAAVALNARHVIIENVPNVVADRNGVVQTSLALLKASGYSITSGVLAADKIGWPQTRKRFFIVASRDSAPIDLESMRLQFQREPLPVSWLIDDLARKGLVENDIMHSVPQLSEENEMRVRWLHENNEYNLPNHIRPDCHKDGTTYPAVYGRMFADKPAPTITGGFLTPGRGRFVHPSHPRVLTPREAARIQGFPDWFDFGGSTGLEPRRSEVSQWIGNAVPSILGFMATLSAIGGEAMNGS